MDPQQRLLLEVALGGARATPGIAPTGWRAAATGVFVGITASDYAQLHCAGGPRAARRATSATGSAHSVAAGRLSYLLGLQGPSLAVDTACSSSLVAVHLACQSLRTGECDAGARRRRQPDPLARGDDRCSRRAACWRPTAAARPSTPPPTASCAARAAAWSCSSGCPTPQADGDPILAVIRGSAVNQDGRSSGLTVPNGPAQQAVVRTALASAGLLPADTW